MSHNNNRNYNTRNSGRYNSGQFVPASEAGPQCSTRHQQLAQSTNYPAQGNPAPREQRNMQSSNNFANGNSNQFAQLYNPAPPPPPPQVVMETKMELQSQDMEQMATDVEEPTQRPPWMKAKLMGVKKISNKERRRRQNESLRRLLTPKNALMVLNEMIPGEQLTSQFKVESVQQVFYGKQSNQNFCADLNLSGQTYKGYGENKMTARNAAAEMAIRDIIIKRMSKALAQKANAGTDTASASGGAWGGEGGAAGGEEGAAGGEGGEEQLPMIQLASFALHKLFSEWEYEGHKVPQLKPIRDSVSESGAGPAGAPVAAPRPPRPPKGPRPLPPNAASMHPCSLLTHMRPMLEYRDLGAEGTSPQAMQYTVGVDVDGATYIGKASNKKEARRSAALSACQQIFGVKFDPPTAPVRAS